MEKVKEFLNFILEKEQEALYLECFQEKIEEYNFLVENEINFYCQDCYDKKLESKVEFNLIGKILSPWDDEFYEDMKDSPYPSPRHLFKISKYVHEEYGAVWACYTSIPNPGTSKKKITTCFLVTKIEHDFKIITKIGAEPDTRKWRFYGGDDDESLRLHNLGTPVKVERYLEPTDEWSMKEYLQDK